MGLPEQNDSRLQQIASDYRTGRRLIVSVLTLSLIFQSYIWWVVQGPERPGSALMEFRRASVLGDNNLCAGDLLTYQIALHVGAPGVYDIDISVWSLDSLTVTQFSTETRRVVFSSPADYELPRQWRVPDRVTDPTTGAAVPWPPGCYERRHAISTTSRSTEPSIVAIPFTIRGDCP